MEKRRIIFPVLITLTCFIAAMLCGTVGFYKVIITLCYVLFVLFSILNTFIQRFRFSKKSEYASKITFLCICFIMAMYTTTVSDEMLFRHELMISPESIEMINASIKAESGGYIANIVFNVSYNDLINIVNGIELHQLSSNEINPYTATDIPDIQKILISQMSQATNRILVYRNINEKAYYKKQMLYDKETEIAYYQSLNYNTRD